MNIGLLLKNAHGSGPYTRQNTLLPEHIPAKILEIGWENPILLKFEVSWQKKVVVVFCRFVQLSLLLCHFHAISHRVKGPTPLNRTFQADSGAHIVFKNQMKNSRVMSNQSKT